MILELAKHSSRNLLFLQKTQALDLCILMALLMQDIFHKTSGGI